MCDFSISVIKDEGEMTKTFCKLEDDQGYRAKFLDCSHQNVNNNNNNAKVARFDLLTIKTSNVDEKSK